MGGSALFSTYIESSRRGWRRLPWGCPKAWLLISGFESGNFTNAPERYTILADVSLASKSFRSITVRVWGAPIAHGVERAPLVLIAATRVAFLPVVLYCMSFLHSPIPSCLTHSIIKKHNNSKNKSLKIYTVYILGVD